MLELQSATLTAGSQRRWANSYTRWNWVIEIVNHYIRLFGKQAIEYLVADREFVGEHWIEYLNFN
jgi:hypothetical protein